MQSYREEQSSPGRAEPVSEAIDLPGTRDDALAPVAISIRTKTSVAAAVVFTVAIGIGTAFALAEYDRQHERGEREHLWLIAHAVRSSLLLAMVEGPEKVQEFFSAHAAASRPYQAELLDTSQRVIAATQATRVGLRRTEALESTSVHFMEPYDGYEGITRIEPLQKGQRCVRCHERAGPVLGYLAVTIDHRVEEEERQRLRALLIASALATLGLLMTATWFGLSYLVVGPIRELASVMHRAERGDLDVRVPEPKRPDELTWLTTSFNSMLRRLRRANAELERKYNARMERADRFATVGELASHLAHEIKNPLAGISGALQPFADDEHLDPERASIIASMQSQIRRVDGTIRSLLSFSAPTKPCFETIQVNPIVERVLVFVGQYRTDRPVRIVQQLDAKGTICGDASQLEQVFLNLCLNAIQAMAGGGVLTVRSLDDEGGVRVEVSDTGPGIPEETREKIFRPFFTTRSSGSGLGLPISARIVGDHEGSLDFECPHEGGTRFVVWLPAADRGGREDAR